MLKSSLNQDTVFRTRSVIGGTKFEPPRNQNSCQELIPHAKPLRRAECGYEDTLDLTNELKHAAEQCQLLAGKLQDRRGNARKRPESPKESLSYDTTDDGKNDLRKKIQALVDENIQLRRRIDKDHLLEENEKPEAEKEDEISAKLKATIEENIRLRQILKDVTEVNKRWQKYNQDRQDYVQRLLTTIQELEQKSQNPTKEKVLKESIANRNHCFNMRHSDSDLLDPSGELAMLRKSHDECLRDNARLQKECEDMRANFEELIHELETAKQQNKEHEEMLHLQANMFKEDFLAERKEKLTALARISDLEDEIKCLTKKCQNYEQCLQQAGKAISQESCTLNKETYVKQNYNGSSLTYPRAHRPLSQSKSAFACNEKQFAENITGKKLVTDTAPRETSPNNNSEISAEQFPSEGDNTVVCPRCAMLFPSNRHSEFLDHYRQCKENKSC